MSLPTAPTVATISAGIIAGFDARFSGTVPALPKSFLRVVAKVFSAVFVLLYKYGGFIFFQQYVRTATIEDVSILGVVVSPLKEIGRLVGIGDPAAAVQADLQIDIDVITTGGQLEIGTQFVSADTGVVYLTTSIILLSAATVSGAIRAAFDQGGGDGSGAIGNLEVGDVVGFAVPPPTVLRNATVTAVNTPGADQEDTEVYRQRIFDRFQLRPQGGALLDYKLWGEEPASILSIYAYTGALAGQTDVYVESAVQFDGIPTVPEMTEALDAIQLNVLGLATRQPASAFPNMLPITRTAFDVEVIGLSIPENQTQVETDVEAELIAFFLARAPFVSGVTIGARTDGITKSGLIGLVEDLVIAANGTFSHVNFNKTGFGSNLSTYTLGQGEKAKVTAPVVFTP